MRYVAGQDLRSLVREEGGLAPARAARIVAQVAAALDAAHAAGLVHRDVKPANALLARGEHVYLSDFGLSKHALSVGGETRSGHWVGTLDYVAPEQIRGERLDARADVYALGGVLYFALTASPPYPREGDEAKLWAHLTELPPTASERVEGLPPGLDGVIARALAKQPDDRYPSAGDLGRAALAAAGHEEVRERERVVGVGAAAPDETPTESATPPRGTGPASETATEVEQPARRRRVPRVVLVAGVAAVAAATVAAVLLTGGDEGTTGKPPFKPHVVVTVPVGGRPNSIAIGRGLVLATDNHRKRVYLVDAKTGKLRGGRPTVGVGSRDVSSGMGAAWVAGSRQHAIFKLDSATGRRLARIPLSGKPITVAAGRDAVWVGVTPADPAAPDALVRIDPRTRRVTGTYPMPDGVHALVPTARGIWIVHRSQPALSRFDPVTAKITKRVAVGQTSPGDAAYSGGAVWVTSPQEDTVSRIDDKSGAKVSSGVGRRPTGIAARGDQIWVTSNIDHTLTRIDPRTSEPVGDAVRVPLNPYALAITADSVWLTAVGKGEIARVRYR
jgi:streptogramin lyase